MIATIGDLSLHLAAIITIFMPYLYLIRFIGNNKAQGTIVYIMNFLQFAAITTAFGCLIYSFANTDYSVALVYKHSHHIKPLLYKITGTWGNHEGSMLLWIFELSLVTFAFAITSKAERLEKTLILMVQAIIIAGLLIFLINTSNPFERYFPAPEGGMGLNPLLQDIGLAIHPPALYLGYVSLSIPFSTIIVALLRGEFSLDSAKSLRPYINFAWGFLTLGVGLGSWWAYRELGWGGFWFFDPVENASLMPLLVATTLVHSIIITSKNGELKIWTSFLAIAAFLLSLIGTFLVRSGILTSVHSFASDPDRGMFIMVLIVFLIIISFGLFAFRAHKFMSPTKLKLFSMEGMLLVTNIIFTAATITVLIATIYPVIYSSITGTNLTIGEPYYIKTLIPILIPIIFLASIMPLLKMNANTFDKNKKSFYISLLISLVATIIIQLKTHKLSAISFTTIFLSFDLMIFTLVKLAQNYQRYKLSYYNRMISHFAFGMMAISIALNAAFEENHNLYMKLNQQVDFHGYNINLVSINYAQESNYFLRQADFMITDKKTNEIFHLKPETRFYPVEQNLTTESSIKRYIVDDLYIVIGEVNAENTELVARLFYKPFINLLWISIVMIFCTAIISLFKKRK